MSRINELIEEIERVQEEISSANTLMNTPPTHFGADFTRYIEHSDNNYIRAKVAQAMAKAVQTGRADEIVVAGAILGVLWVGAYAVDGAAVAISAAKARKLLLSCYAELGVKQNMLIDEQQKLIERLDRENDRMDSEVQADREKLRQLTNELKRITTLLNERSV